MTAIVDPVAALRAYLIADAGVSSLVGTRVFGGELPENQASSMPRSCVVLRPAGGFGAFGGGYQQFGDIRVDSFCYGTTPDAAFGVWRAVHGALKQMRRNTQDGTVLHWAKSGGGPITLRDPDADWPFTISTWQVLAAEVAA